MERKGISPLIAAVLLIAFTMAVAAILTAWVTTFTEETAEQVGDEGEAQVSCSFAGLSIYDASATNESYEDGISSSVSVANTGTMDFTGEGNEVTLTIVAEGRTLATDTLDISAGEVSEATFDDEDRFAVEEDVLDEIEIRVASTECPEVEDVMTIEVED